jgi:nucleotide-binding universal stress UspA family protein
MVVMGDAGHEICRLAAELPASVVVLGTHGRGGIKRAIVGSTSDHVVRHCVSPVLVQGAG